MNAGPVTAEELIALLTADHGREVNPLNGFWRRTNDRAGLLTVQELVPLIRADDGKWHETERCEWWINGDTISRKSPGASKARPFATMDRRQ